MKIVALTGPAHDLDGRFVKRDDLIARCRRAGITARPRFTAGTDTLVASRADTAKARNAKAAGRVRIITYRELFEHLESVAC